MIYFTSKSPLPQGESPKTGEKEWAPASDPIPSPLFNEKAWLYLLAGNPDPSAVDNSPAVSETVKAEYALFLMKLLRASPTGIKLSPHVELNMVIGALRLHPEILEYQILLTELVCLKGVFDKHPEFFPNGDQLLLDVLKGRAARSHPLHGQKLQVWFDQLWSERITEEREKQSMRDWMQTVDSIVTITRSEMEKEKARKEGRK